MLLAELEDFLEKNSKQQVGTSKRVEYRVSLVVELLP